jgi:hypothetical protein
MKQMILTGLAQEQVFGDPDPRFFLVFNQGELRVPVPPDSAEVVVQAMYSGQNGVPEGRDPEPVDEDLPHTDPDYGSEEDIPQA